MSAAKRRWQPGRKWYVRAIQAELKTLALRDGVDYAIGPDFPAWLAE